MLDQISMAFLVALQRLTPAERAVLLLRDVFDFEYREIAALVEISEAACRKLMRSASSRQRRKPTAGCYQRSHKPRPKATSTHSCRC